MLVGAAPSFPHIPSPETLPLSRNQVSIRNLSSSRNFKVCLCSFMHPFARFTHIAPSLSRAEFYTHTFQAQASASSERSFHKGTLRRDLQSLKEALTQSPVDDALHSYNQDLQRLKGFLHQHAEAQPKRDVGSAHQRLSKAEAVVLNLRAESVQNHPAQYQPGTQSTADSSGSPQSGSVHKNSDVRTSKRRGRRIPARGLDVLDKLMASQGRTARALLESLQSTEASDDDDDNDDGKPHAHSYGKDNHKVCSEDTTSASFSGRVSKNETVDRKRGSMSHTLSTSRKIDAWKPSHGTTTDNATTPGTFAKSIEKALAPSTAPKTSSRTSSSLASPTNVRVVESSTSTSSSEAYSAAVSDVAKPSLQGQEVLLALQSAAMEKVKLKRRTRKVVDRTSKPTKVALQSELGEWRDAKPIVVKPEWADQIDELERRIENLKNPMELS